jgi:hypothetical protein
MGQLPDADARLTRARSSWFLRGVEVRTMTMGTIRWTTAAALLVASVAGAELDPERNHLACYPVKGKAIKRSVTLDNAFGSEETAALKPVQVCVPTAKTATPAGTDPITVGVPAFTCYRFKVKGKRPKQTVTLTDQFGTTTFSVTRPNLLCAPAVEPGATTTTSSTAAPATTSTAAPSTTLASTSSTSSTVTSTSSTVAPATSSTVAVTTTSDASTTSTSSTGIPTTTVADTTTTTADTTTSLPDTTTSSTDTTTTTMDTTTTLPTCTLAAGDPQLACTGVCPLGFSCLYTGAGGNPCECSPDASACGNQSAGQCGSGLCPGGLQACFSGGGGCACLDIG